MGDDYTIADIATFPWVRNLIGFYGAGELVEIDKFPHVLRALAAFVARLAVEKGLNIPRSAWSLFSKVLSLPTVWCGRPPA